MKPFNWFLDLIVPHNVIGITLYPFGIYFRGEIDERTIRHEKIHYAQQKEMLAIFFYLWYFIEWVIKLFIYGRKSYYNISFEREAYLNEGNESYNRKPYSWIKYLKT
jgi:hypothetical protein